MKLSLVALLTLACAACTAGGRPPLVVGEPGIPAESTTCPFGFRGTRVTLEDTDEGASILLTAYGDVGELRRRAHDAAAMYGEGAHRGLGHQGRHGMGQQHGLGLTHLGVRVRAKAIDTPDGARIDVWPIDPKDRERMQSTLRARADSARTGSCR